MKLEGAIFDLDGTLLESMHIWDSIGEIYLRSRGVEPREKLSETFKNMSLEQAARYYQTEYGLKDSVEAIVDGVNRTIEHEYRDMVQPKPGARDFLDMLKARGVRMCVATATDRHLVEAALERLGLLAYFGEIFTCASVGAGKDRPVIFQRALDFLGTEKEKTWVFEDALYAVRTAQAAGFFVAALRDPYEKEAEALRALADVYADSLWEMREKLC